MTTFDTKDEMRRTLANIRNFIPPLTNSSHKGSSGRIAVVGGSFEYTGAPYYAAISALRTGADLAFVFCTSSAALPIKSYSPELMVFPCLDTFEGQNLRNNSNSAELNTMENNMLNKALQRLQSLHCVVVGPGLGRDELVFESAKRIIFETVKLNKNLVIDGDGLFLLTTNKEVLHCLTGYPKVVLTPNIIELQRLYNSVFTSESNKSINILKLSESDRTDIVVKLCKELRNITILSKGNVDIISNGKETIKVGEFGSKRRCGGQGDVLSGVSSVFISWNDISVEEKNENEEQGVNLFSVVGASLLMRKSAERAFEKYFRSVTTLEIINEIGTSFRELFENEENCKI